MERYSLREPFCFAMYMIGSTIRPTPIKKLAVIVLQRIMTPPFVSLDIFSLVIQYLFSILFITMMDA